MSRVKFVTSKGLPKSGKIQIRNLYAIPPSIKLVEAPIPRPASPTAPSRAASQQNQHATQNPPPSSSSLKPPVKPNPTPLLLSSAPSPNSFRNLPHWILAALPAHQQIPSHYRFESAAHGIPKQRPTALPPEDSSLHLAVQVGEDAYFVANNGLGVADGVGGWNSSKHSQATARRSNSSLFSRRLMHYCSLELQNTHGDPDPVDILQKSYTTAVGLSLSEGLVGSSTALLGVLAKDGRELRVAHVGDCCIFLIRDKEIVFRSEEMQHRVRRLSRLIWCGSG